MTVRVLALFAGLTNVVTMFIAALAADPVLFLIALTGAGFSICGALYYKGEAKPMGAHKTTYQSLAMRLRWEFKEESTQPGQKLPGTRELATKYGVARRTVIKALRLLAEEGAVEIVPGRGSFIAGAHRDTLRERVVWEVMRTKSGDAIPTIEILTATAGGSPESTRRIVADLTRQGLIRMNNGRRYRI